MDIDIFHSPEEIARCEGLIDEKSSRRTRRLLDVIKAKYSDIRSFEPNSPRRSCLFHYNHLPNSIAHTPFGSRLCFNFVRGEREEVSYNCDLIVTCIGYEKGVQDSTIYSDPNVYYAGWAQTGAAGALASTMLNSKAVADDILSRVDLPDPLEDVDEHLKGARGRAVSLQDWAFLDQLELNEGLVRQKCREKVVDPLVARSILNFRLSAQGQ